jgi:hypothetical protein
VTFHIPFIGKVGRKYFCTFWGTGRSRIHIHMAYIRKNNSLVFLIHGNLNNKNSSCSNETYDRMNEYLDFLEKKFGEPIATRNIGGKSKKNFLLLKKNGIEGYKLKFLVYLKITRKMN